MLLSFVFARLPPHWPVVLSVVDCPFQCWKATAAPKHPAVPSGCSSRRMPRSHNCMESSPCTIKAGTVSTAVPSAQILSEAQDAEVEDHSFEQCSVVVGMPPWEWVLPPIGSVLAFASPRSSVVGVAAQPGHPTCSVMDHPSSSECRLCYLGSSPSFTA
jgi:hypothetical protein